MPNILKSIVVVFLLIRSIYVLEGILIVLTQCHYDPARNMNEGVR
jgi:hypothetical protein